MILFMLTVITVIVVDLTDFVYSVKKAIWKWVWKEQRDFKDFGMRPFDCSLCLSWWVGLIYLLISGTITLPLVLFQLFISYMTPIIKDLVQMIKDMAVRILDMLYTYLSL